MTNCGDICTLAIENFRHKGLEDLFHNGKSAKVRQSQQKMALRIMDYLNQIVSLNDCRGYRDFHPLKGDRKGIFAVSVSGNYRITFGWLDGKVLDVDLEDYH